MNNIDSDFNGIDSKTSRPFSGGHPDGVWFIAILYGLMIGLSVVSILGVLVTLIAQKTFDAGTLVQAILNIILFVPMVVLLFRRSALVLKLSLLTLAINLVLAIFYGYFKQPEAISAGVTGIFQLYIFFYFRGLVKDSFLHN